MKSKIHFPWYLKIYLAVFGLGLSFSKIAKPKRKAKLWGYIKTNKL